MHVVSPAGNPRRAARQRFHHFSWPGAPHADGTKSWSDICASPHPSFAGSTGCSIMCSLPAASDAAPPLGRCVFCTASVALAMDSVILAAGACRHIATTANPPGNNVCKCTTRLRPQARYTTARATPPHNNGRSTITPANPPHDDSHTPATQLRPHIPPTPTTAKPPHDNEHKPTTQHRPHICQHNSNRKATTNSGNSTDKRS